MIEIMSCFFSLEVSNCYKFFGSAFIAYKNHDVLSGYLENCLGLAKDDDSEYTKHQVRILLELETSLVALTSQYPQFDSEQLGLRENAVGGQMFDV